MDVDEMVVHGWKFRIINEQLEITSAQDANAHLTLTSEAAFSLLDYLYRYRNALAAITKSNEREPAVLQEDAASDLLQGPPQVS